ncbi:MAG: undecaprenyl-phosphate glucose phosphotransferase [Methylophaga sp.]
MASLPIITQGNLSLTSLLKHVIEPVVAVLTLVAVAAFYGDTFNLKYTILCLLILVITYPGEWITSTVQRFARRLISSWLIIVVLLLLLGYGTRTLKYFPQEIVVTWAILTPLMVLTFSIIIKMMVGSVQMVKSGNKKAIIIGANELGGTLASRMNADEFSMIEVVGFFDNQASLPVLRDAEVPLLGEMSDVAEYCKTHQIDNVYIALPMANQPRILQLLDDLRDTTVSIYFLPDLFLYDMIQARIDTVNGVPVVGVCETPFLGLNGLVKRISDIVLSSIILVLISPILLALAIGVKKSSPGPVLFKQYRYGLDGSKILVYKFRSMKVHKEEGFVKQASKDDDRITKFGQFIRKTSLDELPQFINVFQGRMSIVGPRPHAVSHNEEYRKLIKGYMVRHMVKPGITGWAQVNGFRGETQTLDKMENRIRYDIDYLRHWSLYLDLWIILRTVMVVFRGDENAY